MAHFENATAEEWTRAHRMLAKACRASGYEWNRAEDIASEAVLSILKAKWNKGVPSSVHHAASIMRKMGRRYGWIRFDKAGRADARRSLIDTHQVCNRQAEVTPSPSSMAMMAERRGVSVDRVHEAYGVGGYAMAEPGTTPSIYAAGPGAAPPLTGKRGIRLETDPNAAATLQAAHRGAYLPQYMDDETRRDYLAQLRAMRGE